MVGALTPVYTELVSFSSPPPALLQPSSSPPHHNSRVRSIWWEPTLQSTQSSCPLPALLTTRPGYGPHGGSPHSSLHRARVLLQPSSPQGHGTVLMVGAHTPVYTELVSSSSPPPALLQSSSSPPPALLQPSSSPPHHKARVRSSWWEPTLQSTQSSCPFPALLTTPGYGPHGGSPHSSLHRARVLLQP